MSASSVRLEHISVELLPKKLVKVNVGGKYVIESVNLANLTGSIAKVFHQLEQVGISLGSQERQEVYRKFYALIEEKSREWKQDDRCAMVPFLVTDTLIAEECWDREKGEAFFFVKEFGKNPKVEEKIEVGGITYFPLVNSTLKKRLVLLPSGIVGSSLRGVFEEGCELALQMYDCENDKEDEVKFLVGIAQSSWFLDRYNIQIPGMGAFAPIIAIRGQSGGGKDRLMNALRLNSYRPFYDVSTRRIPSLYRPLDQWRGSLFLSEMDFANSSETSELTHYLNCRSYGVPISRQNPDNPKYNEVFYNFGLTCVTQRRIWEDNALEDRSLPFYCEKSQNPIPTAELDEWIEKGLRLMNKLLYLRLNFFENVFIDKGARIEGIKDHRLTASVLPLLALGRIEPSFTQTLIPILKKMERRRREVKAMSTDGVVINRLYDYWKDGDYWEHNGIKYMVRQVIKVKNQNDEVTAEYHIPLQTSDLAEELKWTSKQVRSVLNSLRLHPELERLPCRLRVGERTYRPIWFDEGRLKKRFEEFVVDFVPDVPNVPDNNCEGGQKPQKAGSKDNGGEEGSQDKSGTNGTSGTPPDQSKDKPKHEVVRIDEPFRSTCAYCFKPAMIGGYVDGRQACMDCINKALRGEL